VIVRSLYMLGPAFQRGMTTYFLYFSHSSLKMHLHSRIIILGQHLYSVILLFSLLSALHLAQHYTKYKAFALPVCSLLCSLHQGWKKPRFFWKFFI